MGKLNEKQRELLRWIVSSATGRCLRARETQSAQALGRRGLISATLNRAGSLVWRITEAGRLALQEADDGK